MSVDSRGLLASAGVPLLPSIPSKTYFIVRHGSSVDNEQGERYSGITDSPLTDEGVFQARCVARALQQAAIEKIVTSPLVRSLATAREIHEMTGAPLVIDARLREMAYGEWEGLTHKEVRERWPGLYEKNKEDPASNPPPGGEGVKSVLVRAVGLFSDLESASQYRKLTSIALVTHSTVARVMLCYLSGAPVQKYRERRIDNASITKVVRDGSGVYAIVSENDTRHLRDGEIS